MDTFGGTNLDESIAKNKSTTTCLQGRKLWNSTHNRTCRSPINHEIGALGRCYRSISLLIKPRLQNLFVEELLSKRKPPNNIAWLHISNPFWARGYSKIMWATTPTSKEPQCGHPTSIVRQYFVPPSFHWNSHVHDKTTEVDIPLYCTRWPEGSSSAGWVF